MSVLSLFAFFAFLVYLYLSIYTFRLDPRSKLNRTFSYLSLSFTIWAFAYIFFYSAPTKEIAWFWYRISSLGWCFFPGIFLHFSFILIEKKDILKKWWLYIVFYLPGIFFTYKAVNGTFLVADFVHKDFGWCEIAPSYSLWFWSYPVYYTGFILVGLLLILNWGNRSKIIKNKKQANVIARTAFPILITAAITDSIMPALNVQIIPSIASILILGWVFGIWYSIVKYKFMILTPSIAAEEIIDKMVDLLVLVTPEGNIIEVNRRVKELLGYDEKELIGKPLSTIISEEDFIKGEFLKVGQDSSLTYACELTYKTKNGEDIPVSISCSAINDNEGDMVGIVVVGQDVRQMKRLLLEVAERKKTEEALLEEKNKLEAIITSIGDGVTVQDTNFRVLYQNEVHKKIHGNRTGEYCYRAYHNNDRVCEQCLLIKSFKDGKLHRSEINFTTDKGIKYFEVTANPIRDAKGNIIAGIDIVRDITDRRKAEERINFLASIVQAIPEAVCSIDPNGNILSWNEGAEKMLGYPDEEMIGRPISTVIPAEMVGNELDHYMNILNSKGSFIGYESVRITKDKRLIPVEITAVALKDKNQNIVSYASIMRDITERKKMEEDILKTEKLESLGILASGIAHDFNNLLTAILGNISISKIHAKYNQKAYEILTEVERASYRAKDLTQQLLTFSKGGVPVKKVTAIARLVRDATDFALRGSNIICKFFVPDTLWAVEVDEGQISQVFHNLIINANHAMPKGGTIQVRFENVAIDMNTDLPLRAGNYVKISVEDEGIGIPEEHLQKIFDPYFTTKQKGSGLGLATAYSVIKRHDGCIAVESGSGIGTIFYIYLPATDKKIFETRELGKKLLPGKGRVLVMEDEEIIRLILGKMLMEIGYEAEFSVDGEQAIKLYKKAKNMGKAFDAVLIDLTIRGGMGGTECIKNLLEIDPEVKAIVSSGYSDDPVISNYREFGFKNIITKPYRIEELSEILYKVIYEIYE